MPDDDASPAALPACAGAEARDRQRGAAAARRTGAARRARPRPTHAAGAPADGDRYIVASGATGAWAGWDLNVAYWVDGAWMRLPRPGWQAWVIDETAFLAWDGTAWSAAGLPAFFSDAVFELAHDADPTRRAVFDLASIAAGVTAASRCRTSRRSSRVSPARRPSTATRPSPASARRAVRWRRSAPRLGP